MTTHTINGFVQEGLSRTKAMFAKSKAKSNSTKAQVLAVLHETGLLKKPAGVVTGAFVVPTKHGGNHNYKVGKAFFIPSDVQLNGNDTLGNCVYFSNGRRGKNIARSLLRPAKQSEIVEFLNTAYAKKADSVIRTLTQAARSL